MTHTDFKTSNNDNISSKYHTTGYWDSRYKKCVKNFEWYCSYEQLSDCFYVYCEKYHSILILGCGESRLSSEMMNAGYLNVMSMDISQTLMSKIAINSQNVEGLIMV